MKPARLGPCQVKNESLLYLVNTLSHKRVMFVELGMIIHFPALLLDKSFHPFCPETCYQGQGAKNHAMMAGNY